MSAGAKINLIILVLLGIICAFVFKETLYESHKELMLKKQQLSALAKVKVASSPSQSNYNKSLVYKVLSLESSPDGLTPQSTFQEHTDSILAASSAGHRHIAARSRLYTPTEKEIEEAARDDSQKPALPLRKVNRGPWLALPKGFNSADTNAYLIYREELPVTDKLKKYMDEIHGNFVLDVVPFSLFSDYNKVFVMMFRSKDKYRAYSSMPEWSIATTDLDKNTVYIIENNSFKGNFVHELSHIYYDGFFKPLLSPLWLSEGFAVRMQSHAQSAAERQWLEEHEDAFRLGEYIVFEDFINIRSLEAYKKDEVLTWYAQAYSVVDYLLNHKGRDEFYHFSKNIKEGQPLERAMYRAYGMPFNTLSALEYAWQADLQKNYNKKLSPSKGGE